MKKQDGRARAKYDGTYCKNETHRGEIKTSDKKSNSLRRKSKDPDLRHHNLFSKDSQKPTEQKDQI